MITAKNWKMTSLVLMISAVALLAATGAVAITVDKGKWPKKMSIGTSPIGGANYALASVLCPIVNKYAGTNIVPENTGGNVANIQLIDSGQVDLAMSTTGIALEAWMGTADWTKGKKHQNYRSMVIMDPHVIHFYTLARINIFKLSDLNDKVVSLNVVGSASNLWGTRTLAALGIKPKKVVTVSPGDSNNLLKDGIIDAALCMGAPPHTAVVSLQATHPIRVISYTEEEIQKIMNAYPGLLIKETMPPNTFKGQKEEIKSIAQYDILVGASSLPDDMVYMIVKTMFEYKDELAAGYKALGHLDPKNVKYNLIPLHPGAHLYYQEKNLEIPKQAMPVK